MRFIVLDGLDASGKDTHARMIKERYEDAGEDVILRSHPTCDNPFGFKAKEALLGTGKKDKVRASYYYAADVFRSLKKYHGKADTLIFVRYLCGVAYLPSPLHRTLYDLFYGVLPTTDYMFFLDVHPKESMKRINDRSQVEIFENLSSLKKVRKKALGLVDDWFIIDTNQSIYKAQNDINCILDTLDSARKRGVNLSYVKNRLKTDLSYSKR